MRIMKGAAACIRGWETVQKPGLIALEAGLAFFHETVGLFHQIVTRLRQDKLSPNRSGLPGGTQSSEVSA